MAAFTYWPPCFSGWWYGRGEIERIESQVKCVKEIMGRLESGEVTSGAADLPFEDGQKKLNEIRDFSQQGEGDLIGLPE